MNIRLLDLPDENEFIRVRREALINDPEAFGASPEEEVESAYRFFKNAVEKEREFMVGAFDGDLLIGLTGFVQERHIKSKHRGIIWGVYVDPNYRGRGLGSQILELVIKTAFSFPEIELITLGVSSVNKPAKGLYESFGFKTFGDNYKALLVDGKYINEYLMMLTKEEHDRNH